MSFSDVLGLPSLIGGATLPLATAALSEKTGCMSDYIQRDRGLGDAMAAYVVGLYNFHNRDWLIAYKDKVTELIAKHGGKYIARASNCPWEMLEGNKPDITGITIIEFPTMDAARAWHSDIEYQPFIKLRQAGSQLDLLVVEGCDE